jgi:hypothetical protein
MKIYLCTSLGVFAFGLFLAAIPILVAAKPAPFSFQSIAIFTMLAFSAISFGRAARLLVEAIEKR